LGGSRQDHARQREAGEEFDDFFHVIFLVFALVVAVSVAELTDYFTPPTLV
jgi:hypothetical protein